MAAVNVAHQKSNGVNGHATSAICSLEDFLDHPLDYIIVGERKAGLVLAARLSENSNIHVGVLEAGQNGLGNMLVSLHALFSKLLSNPNYYWMLKLVPEVGQSLPRP